MAKAERKQGSPFDDEPASEQQPPAPSQPPAAPRGRQGDDGKPYCQRHNCLMVAQSTKGEVTYYACPVPGCDCKEKKARPNVGIPAKPQYCPNKTCRDEHEQPNVALEVDGKRSSANPSQLTMVCPACHWETKVPRPTDRDRLLNRPRQMAAEDLAAR